MECNAFTEQQKLISSIYMLQAHENVHEPLKHSKPTIRLHATYSRQTGSHVLYCSHPTPTKAIE